MSESSIKKYSHLPLVPETILKKRHDLDALVRKRAAADEEQLQLQQQNQQLYQKQRRLPGGNNKKAVYVVKPETFISRAISRRNHGIRYQRVLRKGMQKRASNKPQFIMKEIIDPNVNETEKKEEEEGEQQQQQQVIHIRQQSNSVGTKHCVFVIRVRDDVGLPRKIKKILKDMRLKKQYDGIFVHYNDVMRRKLHCIEPWIIYGTPSKAVVADLIKRRGFGTINDNERVPLSDNIVVEKALGEKHNMICVEDIIHEIFHVGPSFDAASKFLWPFHLTDPKSRLERKTLRIKDGKEYGDQGEGIDGYINQVL